MGMVYGAKILKNGKRKGILEFSTGKVVRLNPKELEEFEQRVRIWKHEGVE